jgi:hypothetical protein
MGCGLGFDEQIQFARAGDHNIMCVARRALPKIHKIVFSFDKCAAG